MLVYSTIEFAVKKMKITRSSQKLHVFLVTSTALVYD
jgi:hypothetical protein